MSSTSVREKNDDQKAGTQERIVLAECSPMVIAPPHLQLLPLDFRNIHVSNTVNNGPGLTQRSSSVTAGEFCARQVLRARHRHRAAVLWEAGGCISSAWIRMCCSTEKSTNLRVQH